MNRSQNFHHFQLIIPSRVAQDGRNINPFCQELLCASQIIFVYPYEIAGDCGVLESVSVLLQRMQSSIDAGFCETLESDQWSD